MDHYYFKTAEIVAMEDRQVGNMIQKIIIDSKIFDLLGKVLSILAFHFVGLLKIPERILSVKCIQQPITMPDDDTSIAESLFQCILLLRNEILGRDRNFHARGFKNGIKDP